MKEAENQARKRSDNSDSGENAREMLVIFDSQRRVYDCLLGEKGSG